MSVVSVSGENLRGEIKVAIGKKVKLQIRVMLRN